MHIATTGSIKELLVYYGKITLKDIKAKVKIINAANENRDSEDEKIYTFLMPPLTIESINTVKPQQ